MKTRFRKAGEVPDVAAFYFRISQVIFVSVAGSLPAVIGPNDVIAELLQSVIGSAASAEKRNCAWQGSIRHGSADCTLSRYKFCGKIWFVKEAILESLANHPCGFET